MRLVTVTINQYDTGGTINSPYFATASRDRRRHDHGRRQDGRQIDPDSVGHTFTIHAAPTNQDPLFVSVPLPARADDAPVGTTARTTQGPHVVTFSFVTGGPGEYVWNCEYPCGDGYYAKFGGPMATQGYMSGTFTVG